MLGCVHEQKAQGLIGMANKNVVLRRLWAVPNDSKHNEASFSTDSLSLQVAQVPRSRDLVMINIQADRQNQLFYLLLRMHARDNLL